jgi:hypothetical protein
LRLLQKNIGKTLTDIGVGNNFLNRIPIAQEIIRTDKCDCIKLIIFCTAKEAVIRMKRQPREWEKILQVTEQSISFQNI